jgi:hypothetical protein
MIQQGTNDVYPEVEGLSLLLGFKTQNAGCCKVSDSGRLAGFGAMLITQQTNCRNSSLQLCASCNRSEGQSKGKTEG